MFKLAAVVAAASALADAQAVTLTCSTPITVPAEGPHGATVASGVSATVASFAVNQPSTAFAVAVNNDGPAGGVFPYVANASKRTDHTVTFTVVGGDSTAQNAGCTTVVTVTDEVAPVLSDCPAGFNGTRAHFDNTWAKRPPTAVDLVDGQNALPAISMEIVGATKLTHGTHTVTWRATDRSGNFDKCEAQQVDLACQAAPLTGTTTPASGKFFVPTAAEDKVNIQDVLNKDKTQVDVALLRRKITAVCNRYKTGTTQGQLSADTAAWPAAERNAAVRSCAANPNPGRTVTAAFAIERNLVPVVYIYTTRWATGAVADLQQNIKSTWDTVGTVGTDSVTKTTTFSGKLSVLCQA